MNKCSKCGVIKPSIDFYKFRYNWCKKCTKEYNRHWYQNQSSEYKRNISVANQNWASNNKSRLAISKKKWVKKIKLEVFNHYTNNNIRCQCPSNQCTETHIEFMTIDHIEGGGTQHRKELSQKGTTQYVWIKNNNYPLGFRILCMNCNFAFGIIGYCPHSV